MGKINFGGFCSLKKTLALIVLVLFAAISSCAAESGGQELSDGFNAYKNKDYVSAVFLFRKAMIDEKNCTEEALYMLIMAEVNTQEYRQAVIDADRFFALYPSSIYREYVEYHKGRALCYKGEYDKAVLVLSEFCHHNPDSDLYASALFWIGECFYAGYNFDEALPLYRKVCEEYPSDPKAVEAKYRIAVITQRSREDKLLYLLKKTGEEYLSSKENYEKQIRRYEMERSVDVNTQLGLLRTQNATLESALEAEKNRAADLERRLGEAETRSKSEGAETVSSTEELQRLKESARQIKSLLEKE